MFTNMNRPLRWFDLGLHPLNPTETPVRNSTEKLEGRIYTPPPTPARRK